MLCQVSKRKSSYSPSNMYFMDSMPVTGVSLLNSSWECGDRTVVNFTRPGGETGEAHQGLISRL